MKLTLVSVHPDKSPQTFPLSAAMLAANVLPDVDVQLINFYPEDKCESVTYLIKKSKPDVVGFSVYLWNISKIKKIATALKLLDPALILIAGGPEVTADPKNFDTEDLFDALFAGEGEKTLNLFLKALQREESFPKIYNQQTALDVTELSSPFLKESIDIAKYDGILWELSRGCVFNCSFCFESRGIRQVREFTTEKIEKELKLFKKKGVTQIFVLDPTFNLHPGRAKELLSLFNTLAPDIHFTFEIRSEFLDSEMAELFSSLTCSIQIGLQSIHNPVLKNINRTFNRDDFYSKILLLHEAGVVYGLDLIFGLPGDTFEGFCRSLDFALSIRPNHLDIFPLAVLKGTELYERAEYFSIVFKEENPYTVVHTPDFSREDMLKAQKLAVSTALFYNAGEAVPWFSMFLESSRETPSSFLTKFADFLTTAAPELLDNNAFDTPPDILTMTEFQTAFISRLFQEKSLEKEGKAAQDIVRWFNTVSFLIHSESESIKIQNFNFNINNLAENIEMDIGSLEELALFTPMTPCKAEIAVENGEVFTRIIESTGNL